MRNGNEFLDAHPVPLRIRRAAAVGVALSIAVLVVDVTTGRFFPRMGVTRESGFGVMEVFFPVA